MTTVEKRCKALEKARAVKRRKREERERETARALRRRPAELRRKAEQLDRDLDVAMLRVRRFSDRPRWSRAEEEAWNEAERLRAQLLGTLATLRRLENG